MGYEAKKTEHCGPKRGNGAYWGYKREAKNESNRIRRESRRKQRRFHHDPESYLTELEQRCLQLSLPP